MSSPTGLEAASQAGRRRSLGVAELVARLQVGLSENFPNRFWVEGEISGFKVARSGHAFFALKETNAQIEAVIWRDRLARLAGAPLDKGAGIDLFKKVGDRVEKGEALYRIHACFESDYGFAATYADEDNGYTLGDG